MPRGTRISVAGYDKLEPLKQGALDGLCSIYSIINAATLAAYPIKPLTKLQQRRLFQAGVHQLGGDKLVRVAIAGMNERAWIRLRDQLYAELIEIGGPRIRAEPLVTAKRATFAHLMDQVLTALEAGFPVSLALWGAYDHFTVAAGLTATNLLLFDSWGFRRVAFHTLGLRNPTATSRHNISIRSAAKIQALPA